MGNLDAFCFPALVSLPPTPHADLYAPRRAARSVLSLHRLASERRFLTESEIRDHLEEIRRRYLIAGGNTILLDRILASEDPTEAAALVASLATTRQLRECAQAYNWDDGLAVSQAILEHPKCDRGTALMVFWLAEAVVYLTGEIERSKLTADHADFCDRITQRLIRAFYPPGEPYSPELTRVQKYKLHKAPVAPLLYEGCPGA